MVLVLYNTDLGIRKRHDKVSIAGLLTDEPRRVSLSPTPPCVGARAASSEDLRHSLIQYECLELADSQGPRMLPVTSSHSHEGRQSARSLDVQTSWQ